MASVVKFKVRGIESLIRRADASSRDVKKYVRGELREVGQIVARDAAGRFAPTDPKSAAGYRVVVRRAGVVGVDQRLRKTPVISRRRPKFGALQMRRALLPANAANEPVVTKRMQEVVNRLARELEVGG